MKWKEGERYDQILLRDKKKRLKNGIRSRKEERSNTAKRLERRREERPNSAKR
jgi:hypothetical protein